MATTTEARQIETSCQEIMNCISESSLNYSVKLTPYSLHITIRKSFSKTPSRLFQSHSEKALLKQQVPSKLKQMEVYKDTLECRLEEELNYKKKIKKAGAELGQAQVRIDDIVEAVIEVVVKAVVKVEV